MVEPRAEPTGFTRRLLATRTARIAAAVLALFVSVAILAPLIANDRPYVLKAVDMGRYEAARRTLVPVTQAWYDLLREGEEAWNARHPSGSSQTYAEALKSERAAIDVRVRTLRDFIAPSDAVHLHELDSAEGRFLEQVPEAAVDAAQRAADALDPAAKRPPANARGATEGEEWRPVKLVSRTTTPLLSALTPLDAALIAGWLSGLLAILVLRSTPARLAITLVCAVGMALAWRPLVGRDPGPASIKAGIDRGDIHVERAWFPPIPFGWAETRLSEAFRPPTWLASARMRPEGGYERADGRRGVAGLDPDPLPVKVSFAEPPLNAWRRHLLGTDALGRDHLARLVWGARSSLLVGFASALLLTLLGVALGALAGWSGGFVDAAISRTIELVLCFPAFVLVLCAMFFVDPRVVPPLLAVAVVIGLVGWTGVARLVRAECLRLRELEFIAAARALGIGEGKILVRHVLPNAIQPAIIAFSFAIGSAILTESALSFLGFGVQAPVPSWGSLVSGAGSSADHAWIWLFPGLCIFATVAGANLLGEALRDALDPRHER